MDLQKAIRKRLKGNADLQNKLRAKLNAIHALEKDGIDASIARNGLNKLLKDNGLPREQADITPQIGVRVRPKITTAMKDAPFLPERCIGVDS